MNIEQGSLSFKFFIYFYWYWKETTIFLFTNTDNVAKLISKWELKVGQAFGITVGGPLTKPFVNSLGETARNASRFMETTERQDFSGIWNAIVMSYAAVQVVEMRYIDNLSQLIIY